MAAVLAAACWLAACGERKAGAAGVGPYRFGETTRAQTSSDGVCQPTELTDGRKATWCFALPPFKVGKRVAEVDLYFDGTDDSAKLIEIQLKIRGCVEDELDRWMRDRLRPADRDQVDARATGRTRSCGPRR